MPNLEARHDGYVGSGQRPTLFALRDLRKDLALAGSMLGPEASILSLSARTRQLVEDAARDFPDEDISALVRRYRRGDAPAASMEEAVTSDRDLRSPAPALSRMIRVPSRGPR